MITNSSSSLAYFNIDESEEDSSDGDEELSILAHHYDDSHRCPSLASSQNLSETILISTTANIHKNQKVSKCQETLLISRGRTEIINKIF